MSDQADKPISRESRLDAIRRDTSQASDQRLAPGPVAAGPARESSAPARAGYYGQPVLKPPVWTWEVPVYFFVGGTSGMAAVIALAAASAGRDEQVVRAAVWLAAAGAIASPVLLTLDLGRPARFLNMLRVFKWRSPMSVGAWVLVLFGVAAVPAAALHEWTTTLEAGGEPSGLAHGAASVALVLAAIAGAALATYTGVLLGVTAIPAWAVHHRILPVHFGVAALGSAAAALELVGCRTAALGAIGLAAAALETAVGAWFELRRHGPADRALRTGRAGVLLRAAGVLAGPVSLVLRLCGFALAASVAFLSGALVSRFGWVAAGRASGLDAAAALTRAGSAAGWRPDS